MGKRQWGKSEWVNEAKDRLRLKKNWLICFQRIFALRYLPSVLFVVNDEYT